MSTRLPCYEPLWEEVSRKAVSSEVLLRRIQLGRAC